MKPAYLNNPMITKCKQKQKVFSFVSSVVNRSSTLVNAARAPESSVRCVSAADRVSVCLEVPTRSYIAQIPPA